jgi:hypothetical protein
MSEENIIVKVKDVIQKAKKLDWIIVFQGQPYMHIADVEKTIIALLDEKQMERMNKWVEEKEMGE